MISDFVIFCCIALINKSHFTISVWWLIQSRTLSYAMILNWEFHTYIWSVKLCITQKLQVRIEYPSFHLKGLNAGSIPYNIFPETVVLLHGCYCIVLIASFLPIWMQYQILTVLSYIPINITCIFFINIR